MYRHTATEISRDNVSKYMQNILELSGIDLKKYQPEEKKKEEVTGKLGEVKICEVIEEEEDAEAKKVEPVEVKDEADSIVLDDYKVSFLPLTALLDFNSKPKYDKMFDVVYLASNGAGCLGNGISRTFKAGSLVVVETAKFMIELDNDKILGFTEKVREFAKESKLTEIALSEEQSEKCSFSGKPKEEKIKLEKRNHLYFTTQ